MSKKNSDISSKIDILLSKFEELVKENKDLKEQVAELNKRVNDNTRTSTQLKKDKEVLLHSLVGRAKEKNIEVDHSIKNSLVFEKTIDALLECERRGVFDRPPK